MSQIKRWVSLLVIIFLILNNISFADFEDSSSYEGRPIDPSREGIDYQREGDVVVYPSSSDRDISGMSAEESIMMQRFRSNAMTEEEMRRIAKKKFGDKSEIDFEKMMIEFKDRMQRKDTFSYEHAGFDYWYNFGPSYEGYSKEHMIFSMVFDYIGDDIDPREIKHSCNEPEKIADSVIAKLKEKVGDLQKICSRIEERETKCEENFKKSCLQIGTAFVREDATEEEKLYAVAYSCPINKDAIVNACKTRNKRLMQHRLQNIADSCEKRFEFEGERLTGECERFRQNQICDKEKYIRQCLGGIKRQDFRKEEKFASAKWECYDGTVEYRTDSSCRSSESWSEEARKSCENKCNQDNSKCGVNIFSVSDKCVDVERCPEAIVPACLEGYAVQKKADGKGCVAYYCEKTTTEVCPRDTRQCPDGRLVSRTGPNCEFAPCPEFKCPEQQQPTCPADSTVEKRTDDKGCVYYYCKYPECTQVSKPACNADEKLETYYDNRGCVTSYQCTKLHTCPVVEKPTCAERQNLVSKYDDKGCIVGYECVTPTATGNVVLISGFATASNYEELQSHCEKSWQNQERLCARAKDSCDKNSLVERCKEQEKKNYEDMGIKIEQNCEVQTIAEIKHGKERCSRIDEDRKKCLEQGAKRCEHMKGNAEKCRELMTEENIRKFIVEEAKKRCKFTDIIEDEEDVKRADKAEIVLAVLNTAAEEDIEKLKLFIDDLKEDLKLQDTTIYKGMIKPNSFGDVKLLPFVVNAKISARASSERAKEVKAKIVASTKVEETASKLASLRDSDVPAEYLYLIEDKASEVLNVSDSLEDLEKKEEGKGLGYKIRLFLGLAKAIEKEEIKQLEDSKSKLQNSIEALTKLIDEVPSDVAKAILKEQVNNLKIQQAEIEQLIKKKEKKAKGLAGLFG